MLWRPRPGDGISVTHGRNSVTVCCMTINQFNKACIRAMGLLSLTWLPSNRDILEETFLCSTVIVNCVCDRGRGTEELKELLSKQVTVLGDSARHRLEPARASALSACVPCEMFSSRPRGETDTNNTLLVSPGGQLMILLKKCELSSGDQPFKFLKINIFLLNLLFSIKTHALFAYSTYGNQTRLHFK